MTRDDRAFDRELEEMVERGRTVRPLPDVVRARSLARARATMAAAESSATAMLWAPAARGRAMRIAVAASLTLLLGAAGAVAALRVGTLDLFRPAPPSSPRPVTPARVVPVKSAPPSRVAPEPAAAVKARSGRTATAQESYAAELWLLHRAQVTYAGQDFSAALMLVAEHARRFPNGRLAEEREALRVRSLAGAGRTQDARRATAAFAARFPRSVLVPRLQDTAASP
jgi:hypothetical protein